MPTPVEAASGRILGHNQRQAAIKATQERFSLIRRKCPGLNKGYLVLSLVGGQTRVGSSAKDMLKDCPALVVADQAKADLVVFLKTPKPKDASEAEKKRLREQNQQLADKLRFDGSHQIKTRFDTLSYELIWKLQSDTQSRMTTNPGATKSESLRRGPRHSNLDSEFLFSYQSTASLHHILV